MNSEKISLITEKYGLQKFRAQQMKKAFFQEFATSYDDVTNLKKELRQQLIEEVELMTIKCVQLQKSSDKCTYKALLELEDGQQVESVLMSPKPGHWTACISSQVGCAMKCTFCATGTMGLKRNLTSEEITDQVLFWKQFIHKEAVAERLNNVVYMGMGEPLHNTKHVFASLEELMNPETFAIGARHISVSTSGLVKAMVELGERFPQVNLALSLHAANDELRTSMMPVNKAFNLDKLRETLRGHMEKTNRRVFIEYILMDNENDSAEHAQELADYLLSLKMPHLIHVNLIVYNPTESDHRQSTRDKAKNFCDDLNARGVNTTIRKNLGRDIDGACGQLAVTAENTESACKKV